LSSVDLGRREVEERILPDRVLGGWQATVAHRELPHWKVVHGKSGNAGFDPFLPLPENDRGCARRVRVLQPPERGRVYPSADRRRTAARMRLGRMEAGSSRRVDVEAVAPGGGVSLHHEGRALYRGGLDGRGKTEVASSDSTAAAVQGPSRRRGDLPSLAGNRARRLLRDTVCEEDAPRIHARDTAAREGLKAARDDLGSPGVLPGQLVRTASVQDEPVRRGEASDRGLCDGAPGGRA